MSEQNIVSYSPAGPTIKKFHESNAFVRAIMGPIGSAKSTACVVEILRRAQMQTPSPDGLRRTRWVVIRNSYPELKSTSWRTWSTWCPAHFGKTNFDSPITHHVRTNDLDLEVLFLALDRPEDARKLLSLELTGAWVNECREVSKHIVDTLTGRVGRYPSKMQGGCTWSGILLDTNPCDTQSWYYKFAEEVRPEGWEFFRQPSGRSPEAENLQNLPKDYYKRIMSGKDDDFIKVYVDGEYGFLIEGKPVFPQYRDSIHASAEDLIPDPHFGLLLGADFGLCYDDKTEVLTEAGWKFFKDVSLDENVAALNPETFELFYEKPKLKIDQPFIGKLLTCKSNTLSMAVTPDHTIPHWSEAGLYKKAYAKDILNKPGHNRLRMTCRWSGSEQQNPLGLEHRLYCAFMGAYLSEGHVDKVSNRVGLTQIKERKWMADIVFSTPWGWQEDPRGFRCSSEALNTYLRQFGEQKLRFVPSEIRNSSSENILEFIRAYTLGDGHIRTRKNGTIEHTIFTCSEQMAKDFQELALKVGWTSSVRRQKPAVSYYKKEDRWITNTGGWHVSFKKTTDWSHLREQRTGAVDYCGRVYCLSVSTGILCVRRDGRTHFNGNTPACVIAQKYPDGRWEIIDELNTDNTGIKRFAELLATYIATNYPEHVVLGCWADPSGAYGAENEEDTAIGIMNANTKWTWKPAPGDNTLNERLECVRNVLNRLVDGSPGILISPKAKTLRKGFANGYCYKFASSGNGAVVHETPNKNEYSHIHDALQYLLLGGGEFDAVLNRRPDRKKNRVRYAIGHDKGPFD